MKMEDFIFLNVFLYNQLNIIIFTFTIYMPKASLSHEVFHLKRHHHISFFQTPSHPHVYKHAHICLAYLISWFKGFVNCWVKSYCYFTMFNLYKTLNNWYYPRICQRTLERKRITLIPS